mgnify:CR=1 FL=1
MKATKQALYSGIFRLNYFEVFVATTADIRNNAVIIFKSKRMKVIEFQHVKPGKGGAFAQVEMKSINKNTKLNERFRSSETVEKASLDEMNYNLSLIHI